MILSFQLLNPIFDGMHIRNKLFFPVIESGHFVVHQAPYIADKVTSSKLFREHLIIQLELLKIDCLQWATQLIYRYLHLRSEVIFQIGFFAPKLSCEILKMHFSPSEK